MSAACDDSGHSPNEHGQCDDCRDWVMDDTREIAAALRRAAARTVALKRAARRWATADAAWAAVGCPDMGRNAVEARAIHERADARSILLSAAADFANL